MRSRVVFRKLNSARIFACAANSSGARTARFEDQRGEAASGDASAACGFASRLSATALILLLTLCRLSVAAERKITVAADGTGDYKTPQEAIAAVPDNSADESLLHIKPGTYQGQIVVPQTKHGIRFEGDDAASTILSFSFNQNEPNPAEVLPHYNGIGALILGDGFSAENITFQNTSGDHGQAIALRIDGDRATIRNCRMLGWQDTLMVNTGRQYFKDCYIEGRVDFIYGSGTAVFDHCELHSKNGGYLTAASTPQDHPFGFVFFNCRLTADPTPWNPATTNPTTMPAKRPGKIAQLGRPWRPYAAVAFINCEMGDHIRPAGWNNWGKSSNEQTARYSEYNSTGPGANPNARVAWSKQLTKEEADGYTIKTILGGGDGWNPATP